MNHQISLCCHAVLWLACLLPSGSPLLAQLPLARPNDPAKLPVFEALRALHEPSDRDALAAVVRLGKAGYNYLDQHVADYTCTLVKRERVDGLLSDYEFMTAKVRHRQVRNGIETAPFSVYLNFHGPERIRGREVLFVEGRHDGKLFARKGGERFNYMTMSLDPLGSTAMRGNRYPITEVGIKTLTKRLIEVAEDLEKVHVSLSAGGKIEKRECTVIHVRNLIRDGRLQFHQVKIFIDNELLVPVRYEAYDWPKSEGGPPRLLEEYTYLNLQLNVGFRTKDFALATYGFRPPAENVTTTEQGR